MVGAGTKKSSASAPSSFFRHVSDPWVFGIKFIYQSVHILPSPRPFFGVASPPKNHEKSQTSLQCTPRRRPVRLAEASPALLRAPVEGTQFTPLLRCKLITLERCSSREKAAVAPILCSLLAFDVFTYTLQSLPPLAPYLQVFLFSKGPRQPRH
jgi:hypothetical protein